MYKFFFSSLVTWNFYLEMNENNFLECCLLSPGNDIFQNFLDISFFCCYVLGFFGFFFTMSNLEISAGVEVMYIWEFM